MTSIRIEPEAAAELEAAALRYEQAVPGLGSRFLGEMRARVGHVLEAPGSFPVFGNTSDVRCALAFMHPRQRLGVKAFLIVEHDEPPMRPGIDELECTLAVT